MNRSSNQKQHSRLAWNRIFSKSSLGPDVYFIRGTASLYTTGYNHEAWNRIVETLDTLGIPAYRRQDSELSMVIARERSYSFLDGDFASHEGNYLFERKGSWITGRKVLRFLYYELELTQRRRFPGELGIPTHEARKSELQEELKERFASMNNLYHLDRHPKYQLVQQPADE